MLVLLAACAPPPAPDSAAEEYVDPCDGASVGARLYYRDADGDGFGVDEDAVARCLAPEGYAAVPGDCDDTRADIYSGAPDDACDGEDQDCDGVPDDGVTEPPPWYWDADGDGYGKVPGGNGCTPPEGGVSIDGDCADTDARAWPGGNELCDGIDNDCDAVIDPDCGGQVAIDLASWTSSWQGEEDGDQASLVTALSASGPAERLAIVATNAGEEGGHVYLLDAPPAGVEALGAGPVVRGGSTWLTGAGSGGDADGDGLADLCLSVLARRGGPVAGVVPGDYADSAWFDEAVAGVWKNDADEEFAARCRFGGATRGGRAEAVISAPSVVAEGATGAVWVCPPALGEAVPLSSCAGILATGTERLLGEADAVGDLDGDGLADLVLSVGGVEPFVVGFAGPVAGQLTTGDASLRISHPAPSAMFGAGLAVADLAGDGLPEVVVGAPGEDRADDVTGFVYVLPPEATSTADAAATLLGEVCNGAAGAGVAEAGDLDADGREDLLIRAPTCSGGRTYVQPGGIDGVVFLEESPLALRGLLGEPASDPHFAGNLDLDGDGVLEIAVGQSGELFRGVVSWAVPESYR